MHPFTKIPPSVDEVVQHQLYIGNLSSALSLDLRAKLGITHIVSVCPDLPSTEANHLVIAVDDSEYEDLLIHLPRACHFIQSALNEGGRVLVHCVMGISRSATVLAAYLMQSRRLDSSAALQIIRNYRPTIQPNYGFLKQLDVFADCHYAPTTDNITYMSWKRRQEQNVTSFLNQMIDTTPIIPDQLFLSSEFPDDVKQAESLLLELGITHLLSITPSTIPELPSFVKHHHIELSQHRHDGLLIAMPEACNFIRQAIAEKEQVLVHCEVESKAAIVVCGYLMCTRNLTPDQAHGILDKALPLFNRTANFDRHLEAFDACAYAPTPDNPLVKEWASARRSSSFAEKSSYTKEMAAVLQATARSALSDTSVDMSAFGEALQKLQKSHVAGVARG